jgi:hypothetical protein
LAIDQPNSPSEVGSPPQRSKPDLLTRLGRAPITHKLPELDLVADEALRHRLLTEIEQEMTPRTWKSLAQFLAAVVLFLIVPVSAGYLVSKVLLPPSGRWNNWLFLAIVLVGYTVIVFFAIRRDIPKTLRRKLNGLGIPVCLRCGYDLRGGVADRTTCPECGGRLTTLEMQAMAKAATGTSRERT